MRVIHERTDGNPLFIVAVVDALVQQGWVVEVGARWRIKPGAEEAAARVPRSLQGMVEQLFDGLSPSNNARSSPQVSWAVNFRRQRLPRGTDEALRLVEDRCAELARRGQFLMAAGVEAWPDGTIAERYRLVHSLYQHVVYERLSPGRRTQLHGQIGARAGGGLSRADERDDARHQSH